jgi:hypothetical protein
LTGRVSNGGGCGDYLFSGHAIIMWVCMLVLFHQRAISAPRWPLWYDLILRKKKHAILSLFRRS